MTSLQEIIKTSPDWQNAVIQIIKHRTENEEPFSSGEIARDLRTIRPDFRFAVESVGEFIRDMFYSMGFGYDTGPAYQVSRTAIGKFRTPEGQSVFVYCPNPDSGLEHDFEVDIPKPSISLMEENSAIPLATPQHDTRPIVISGQINEDGSSTFKATVHGDGRMQIPRAAFEAFVHKTGNPLRGGDPVFIRVTDKRVTVALEASDNFEQHDISNDRGRVRFMSPTETPFAPGTDYKIRVSDKQILIDLK